LILRNNIIMSLHAAPWMFDGIAGDSTYRIDAEGDAYDAGNSSTIAVIRPVHGVASCQEVATADDLERSLRSITQSGRVSFAHITVDRAPTFVRVSAIDFRLTSTSALIDAGVKVEGFGRSYRGAAPDPGAYEYDPESPTDVPATPDPTYFDASSIIRTQYFTIIGEEVSAEALQGQHHGPIFLRETDVHGHARITAIWR
jgi:hypothetical protein